MAPHSSFQVSGSSEISTDLKIIIFNLSALQSFCTNIWSVRAHVFSFAAPVKIGAWKMMKIISFHIN